MRDYFWIEHEYLKKKIEDHSVFKILGGVVSRKGQPNLQNLNCIRYSLTYLEPLQPH